MKISLIILTTTAIILTISVFSNLKRAEANTSRASIPIDNSIELAINYLEKATLDTGRFVYYSNVNPDIVYSNKKYNALRHAGTLYSMYLCERELKNTKLKSKRYLASKYFIENYIQKVDKDKYAVVSKPEEEKLPYPQAKLGGTGLALIGLSNLYPEGKIDIKILEGLGNFAIYMQKEDGSFYSKYNILQSKRDEQFISLYYPGEVAYGLLFLNEVDPQKKWVNSSKKALLYLANSRKNDGINVPFDHWAMLATKKLFETKNNTLTPEEKLLLQKHTEQMAKSILNKQILNPQDPYRGSFQDNTRLCSIGTIMEGLVAIYYCTDDKELKEQILKALDHGTDFLSRYQLKEGLNAGGIPTNAIWQNDSPDAKSRTIRIDNVQHVLSAWITYKKLLTAQNLD